MSFLLSPWLGSCDVSFLDVSPASLQRAEASGERRIMLFPSGYSRLPGSVQLFPIPHCQMSRRGQPGSWGPAHQLHVNVFKAISGLAIIPTASSDKYRHKLKSPSGRQAALGSVDGARL
jgi:hypothetical protein